MGGYKAVLKYSFADFKGSIPIRYERLTNKEILEKIEIVKRAMDTKEEIEDKFRYLSLDNNEDKTEEIEQLVKRKKCCVGLETGKVYEKETIQDFQVVSKNGKVVEVEVKSPEETTKVFEIDETRPIEKFHSYLFEGGCYEIWADGKNDREINANTTDLKSLAEYLKKNGVCLLFDFQRANTHKPQRGFIKPVKNESLHLLMGLTMTEMVFHHPLKVEKVRKEPKRAKVKLRV